VAGLVDESNRGKDVPLSEHDRGEVRRITVEEIQTHISPMNEKLARIQSGLDRIWNTNGGPPGYLQTRKIEDDAKDAMIMDFISTAQKRRIEEDDRQKQSEKRWAFWKPLIQRTALGGLGAMISLGAWLGPKVVRVGIILWQDYEKAHPEVKERIKTISDSPSPGVSSSGKASQDASRF
jgi:hypothetical protein